LVPGVFNKVSNGQPPRHVAIIMDGNGRWAAQRGLPRPAGHKAGLEALRRTVRAAADLGIEYLTIYSFSTENWSRPPAEVTFLFDLLRRFIRQDVAELHASGVKIKVIGERQNLDADILNLLEDSESLTKDNDKLTLIIAFNYGSRQELTRAFREIAQAIQNGNLAPEAVTCELIGSHLDTEGIPDPDLLIRTSGEQRLSNYLLWQCAYTEFVFVDEHWPDFTRDTLERAIAEFMARDRRFGGVKAQSA
jgi:undecaprenyl diphosphate synthase